MVFHIKRDRHRRDSPKKVRMCPFTCQSILTDTILGFHHSLSCPLQRIVPSYHFAGSKRQCCSFNPNLALFRPRFWPLNPYVFIPHMSWSLNLVSLFSSAAFQHPTSCSIFPAFQAPETPQRASGRFPCASPGTSRRPCPASAQHLPPPPPPP